VAERVEHTLPAEGAKVVQWLLEDNQPAARYYTLIDLLGRKAPEDPD
jgi:hypothetical protein